VAQVGLQQKKEGVVNLEQISGTIRRFIYRNDDFAIAVMCDNIMCDRTQDIIVLGSLFGVKQGEEIIANGTWENHPKHGKQFKIEHWERPMPTTAEQAVEFLSSSLVKGVGPVSAERIVERLGSDAITEIVEKGPDVLRGIKGITPQKAEAIHTSLLENYEMQKVVARLTPLGLTVKMAQKAYKHFGGLAVERIRQNPYCLMDMDMIGFVRADEIAVKAMVSKDSPYRIKAAVRHVLEEACWGLGHCYLPFDEHIASTLKLLNRDAEDVSESDVKTALKTMVRELEMVVEGNAVYLAWLHKAEARTAERVKTLCRAGSARNGMRVPVWSKEFELRYRVTLTAEQKEAAERLLGENLLILTGNPGTGKTTTVKYVLETFRKLKPDAEILLAAPTGRASCRLAEVAGMEASTIHSMLGIRPGEGPAYNRNNPLPCDLLVVDEVSMLDLQLANLLFDAVKPGTKMLLVGDADQLPAVGPGNVLRDMIDAGLPAVRLKVVHRQAAESQIITNAHRILNGRIPAADHSKGDFYFIEKEAPEEIARVILASVVRFLQLGYKMSDILVLSPMKRGPIGTREINVLIQKTVNPPSAAKPEVIYGSTVFRVGDKVMQTRNNKEANVSNGDIGIIDKIEKTFDEGGVETGEISLVVSYPYAGEVRYGNGQMKDLLPAYAVTIHKAQGSESPVVIMPVSTQHYIMLSRNLYYTAVTRAQKKVVMVGAKKALAIAVKNDKPVQRNTRLKERLREARAASGEGQGMVAGR